MPQEARNPIEWRFGKRCLKADRIPLLMGILNVTPDSFSDGGEHNDVDSAVAHGVRLAEDGADVIDIGGESTRPGADPVSLDEELLRTIPVIERLSQAVDTAISIDTTKAEVARQAIAVGAEIVNDISGLTFDVDMPGVCADHDVGVICMHIRGTPQTMQANPHYDDAVPEICNWLMGRVRALESVGIAPQRVMLDPGVGFGKTAEHNLEILSCIKVFRETGHPVLVGHSRKRFLSKVLGRQVEERLAGTLGVAVALAEQSTDMIRVHDVFSTRDALVAWRAVRSYQRNGDTREPERK